ncbi:uncharacterized protein [Leptinotarsa decemlineata]|uniref:uncharacterized protein n=1 Tax=Leptinotarsa decemlineata TaxID=7539 RepID=UPI003D30921B
MKAMTFGATSSPCMAQFVKDKNAEEHYHILPKAAKAIIEKHYVDDYSDSVETEEAVKLILEVIEIHGKAGFSICNWISNSQNTKRYKTFVAVRVGEITEITDASNWHWVSGEDNVADESTRELFLANESRWLIGPEFLTFPKNHWPKETDEPLEEMELEMKRETILTTTITHSYLPSLDRFSKYRRLIRATAWMLRFINNCRKRKVSTNLEYSEVEKAEEMYIKYVQNECFHQEIADLQNKRTISKSSRIYTLTSLLDDKGILKIGGRLEQAKDPTHFQKHPAILDQKDRFTKLLIEHYHINFNHQGQELIMNELRQKFWISEMRSAVRKCKTECSFCRKMRVQPQVPEMGSYLKADYKVPQDPSLLQGWAILVQW